VLLSSAGDVSSSLLAQATELGRRSVLDRQGDRAWFEWSADPSADMYDPATWQATIPTLDRPAGISTAFVALQADSLDEQLFAREYLCVTSSRPPDPVIELAAWERACTADIDSNRLVFGVDATPTGDAATIVAAGRAVDPATGAPIGAGDVIGVEVIDARPGVDWIVGRLTELAGTWSSPIIVDALGPLAWLLPVLKHAPVRIVGAQTADVLGAAATFSTLVTADRVAHDVDPRLDVAIDAARRRRSGDRWGFDRHVGVDQSPLVAASLALWAFETRRPRMPAIH